MVESWDESQIKLVTEVLPHVAAQLRASLSNMHGALKCLGTADGNNTPGGPYAAILNQSYYRLLRLVNNLSAAPMLSSDTLFETKNVELVEWLSDLCRQAEVPAEVSGLSLRFETELRCHIVQIHPEHMERLVWNLLSNAFKFTPAGGTVTVTLHKVGGQLLLGVSDTGCGIPQEQQETVFERYLHADLSHPTQGGLGLGLPLCRRIAQGHGGRLLLHSHAGEGTSVSVAIPDRRAAVDTVQDVPFRYAGGFQAVMMELSDALPYQAYAEKHLD